MTCRLAFKFTGTILSGALAVVTVILTFYFSFIFKVIHDDTKEFLSQIKKRVKK